MDEEHIESVEKTVEAISKKQRIEEAKYQDLAKDDNLVVVDEISDEEIEGMYNCFDHHAGIVISQADEHSPPPLRVCTKFVFQMESERVYSNAICKSIG